MVCSDINSAIGSGADFYQIQASENQFSSTGFTCEDQVNSNYIDIEEDEYDTCIADVLDMQARYAPAGDLCEVMAPSASACPCWEGGMPNDPIFKSCESCSVNRFYLKSGLLTLAKLNGPPMQRTN